MTVYGADLSAAANRVANSLTLPSIANPSAAASTANATGSTSTSADGTDISSSDFLTLLVTEMQNQDPTQPTDPNAYIQQLVGVNSLQQLIAINQDLSGLSTSTTAAADKASTITSPTTAI
jgi:flagellar basal-body rod modification protein FlgD